MRFGGGFFGWFFPWGEKTMKKTRRISSAWSSGLEPKEPDGPPPGWKVKEPDGPPPGWKVAQLTCRASEEDHFSGKQKEAKGDIAAE